ncbi:uncharacterized protein LOC131504017 [Neofelis nebulosa]|uniref:uncharacterized protein LOC131504017 n=1 Tax=Neofelis nebulosa TaxID=61452 RepID=UPI00272CD746|nr:uncharacterized protein LOC131504017 [Neofelis nebulosa]
MGSNRIFPSPAPQLFKKTQNCYHPSPQNNERKPQPRSNGTQEAGPVPAHSLLLPAQATPRTEVEGLVGQEDYNSRQVVLPCPRPRSSASAESSLAFGGWGLDGRWPWCCGRDLFPPRLP